MPGRSDGAPSTWGLRRRLGLSFAVVGGLVIGGLLLGLLGLTWMVAAREDVVGRLSPARTASDEVLRLALDEETAVRGYLLTGREDFLDPYKQAGLLLPGAESTTQRAVTGQSRLTAAFADEQERLRAWQMDYARVAIAGVRHGRPRSAVSDEVGKAEFDALRSSAAAFSRQLDSALQAAGARLDRITRMLEALGVLAVLLLMVLALLTWRLVQRSVLEPLDRLRADAREVAAGDLDHELSVGGPVEIRAVGQDLDTMRGRIVASLAEARASRADAERLRRQAEQDAVELRRSNDDLEQFAYVASHDLQEPLRKVAGFCGLLSRRYRGTLDERADAYIDHAVEGARRMQQLIDDLLAFSRVDRSGREHGTVALNDCVRRAWSGLSERVEQAGAVLEVGPLPVVHGEAGLLTLLLTNVLGNAVKFRGAEPPLVQVGAHERDGSWELSCLDNGIGIDPADAERVLVMFQRLPASDGYDGTGIGLALCRRIVEHHGGRLWVERRPPGTGTEVRWTLPAAPPVVPGPASAAEESRGAVVG